MHHGQQRPGTRTNQMAVPLQKTPVTLYLLPSILGQLLLGQEINIIPI
jgi:hypothetical protein